RDSPKSDVSVVMGDIFHQVIDCVVGVGGLVNLFVSFPHGTDVHKVAVALSFATHVLIDKNIVCIH
ncbi:MAG: hypothetical protein RLZ87_472, partial [Armatimonadota bacterium]